MLVGRRYCICVTFRAIGERSTNLPLLGVSADRIDHDGTISISAARAASEHITHTIHGVTRVYIERTDEGADAALAIESADGTTTILRFRAVVLPETVDGIAPR